MVMTQYYESHDVMETDMINVHPRELVMMKYYEVLAGTGTRTRFDPHLVSFTNAIVSALVQDDTLAPLFGPVALRLETKNALCVGHMVVIHTGNYQTIDPATNAVVVHDAKKLNIYSTIAIANNKNPNAPCHNMNGVSKLLDSLKDNEVSFNYVHEHGAPHKADRGKQPASRFLSFDASKRPVSYKTEENDMHDRREAVLTRVEEAVDERRAIQLRNARTNARANVAAHKKRKALRDISNDKDADDGEADDDDFDADAATATAASLSSENGGGSGSSGVGGGAQGAAAK